jgi:tRNA-Thr(GGU) m(6)t(6)A37 methyltransferase TsaA
MNEFESLRARIVDAEQSGNPEIFEELLADDAVILAPGMPAIEGRDACLEFVTAVLATMQTLYRRVVTCDSAEVVVSGNLAFDRGRFHQHLTPVDGGAAQVEDGHYLWMYRRHADGRWQLARIMGSVTPATSYSPIGVVRSPYSETDQVPKGPGARHEAEGIIEINAALEEGLTDIEGFSHLYVVWVFDRSEHSELMGQPPTADRPHGVFATRSPYRPNPIGLTVVRLLGRDGRRLHVRGLDMLDGTPVLDLKPYLSNVPAGELRRGWLDQERGRVAEPAS